MQSEQFIFCSGSSTPAPPVLHAVPRKDVLSTGGDIAGRVGGRKEQVMSWVVGPPPGLGVGGG